MISAEEFIRRRIIDDSISEEKLLEKMKAIIIKEIHKALEFKTLVSIGNDDMYYDDVFCYFDIPGPKLRKIFEHEYFPHEKFKNWLEEYEWEFGDNSDNDPDDDSFYLASKIFKKEEFGLSKEEVKEMILQEYY